MFGNTIVHIPDLLIQLEAAAINKTGLETVIVGVL